MAKSKSMYKDLYCVILAGGVGTRLWPVSRSAYPKQFLKIFGDKSLLQMTVDRVKKLVPMSRIIIITSNKYKHLVKEQVSSISMKNILCERAPRSTLPTVIWGALKIGPGKIMTSFPSDHLIMDEDKWLSTIKSAVRIAKGEKSLVLLGIKPDSPHTCYGYIEKGKKIGDVYGNSYFEVKRFHEKPSLRLAKKYLKKGGYFWNSGQFIWRTEDLLAAAEKFVPDIYAPMKKAKDTGRSIGNTMKEIRSENIDVGIMEKAKNTIVLPAKFRWSDLGDWNAFFEHGTKDKKGNVQLGPVFKNETADSLLISENGRLLVTNDVKDVVAIVNKDVVFLSSKKGLSSLKPIIKELEEGGHDMHL